MPRADSKKGLKNSAGQVQSRPARVRRSGSYRIPYMVVSAIIVAAVVLVGVAYYQQYYAPLRRVVINVDDTQIRMGYFLDRLRLSGSGGIGMLQTLTNEELIKSGTAALGITVTSQDVDNELRRMAVSGDNVTISEAEFREWYRQLLNDNRMSDAKYRETVKNRLLSGKLQDYLNRQIPPSVEHSLVFGIFVNTYEEALAAKERVESGEDFTKVAMEVSIDTTTGEKGGELDWFPEGTLFRDQIDPFSLEVGQVSDPAAIVDDPNSAPQAFYVLMVKERAVREIQPAYLSEVQRTRFNDWLNAETAQHEIKWDYNSEIDAWVNWQLSKGQSSSS